MIKADELASKKKEAEFEFEVHTVTYSIHVFFPSNKN